MDELGGPGQPDLEMIMRVNGEERQRDRTTSMIWTIDELIEYVVARTSLSTGDVMFTGTTAGVGMEDGRFLEPGDELESEDRGHRGAAQHGGAAGAASAAVSARESRATEHGEDQGSRRHGGQRCSGAARGTHGACRDLPPLTLVVRGEASACDAAPRGRLGRRFRSHRGISSGNEPEAGW